MRILALFLLISLISPASETFSAPAEFPYNNQFYHFHDGKFLRLHSGLIQFYFNTGSFSNTDTIKVTESFDDGLTWQQPRAVISFNGAAADTLHFSPEVMPDGRICIVYTKYASATYGRIYRTFSPDLGTTWSLPSNFGPGLGYTGKRAILKTIGDKVFLFSSSSESQIRYKISQDSGKTFGAESVFPAGSTEYNRLSGIALLQDGVRAVISGINAGKISLFIHSSTNGGTTWDNGNLILSDTTGLMNASVVSDGNSSLYILYDKTLLSKIQKVPQNEIFYIKSSNSGSTWSAQQRYTYYSRTDIKPVGFYRAAEPIVMFLSTRPSSYTGSTPRLYYSPLITGPDDNAPPVIISSSFSIPQVNQNVNVKVRVDDEYGISDVKAAVSTGGPSYDKQLYDDGLHEDELAGDNIWGGPIGAFGYNTTVVFAIKVTNVNSIVHTLHNSGYFQMPPFDETIHVMGENKIVFPIDQSGNLGNLGDSYGITLDGKSLVFSGGFFLSGKKGDTLWGSAQISTSRLNDYLPGNIGSDPVNPDFKLYIVNAGDSAFGTSWNGWRKAVDFGADFYDGNGDAVYNPVDLNGNGVWDNNEDKPDLIGNETAWCIYNDSQKPSLRRYTDMIPRQIEIAQSVYAFRNGEYSLSNAVFVRYKLINKSAFDYDSVYFSAVCDPDIGNHYESDYAGCDTLLASGIAYKKASDAGGFENTPPAVFLTVLQGPAVFIPGVTYTDVNLNGEYDEGIDVPLSNAFNKRGPLLETDTVRGAKNIGMTSFTNYMSAHPTFGDPNLVSEMRNYQTGGLEKSGAPLDVCTFAFGNGQQLSNCGEINPRYLFSGDPAAPSCWLNTVGTDQRLSVNSGPFRLKRNSPMNIVVAYSAVRGSSPLNGVTATGGAVQQFTNAFNANFPVPVGLNEKKPGAEGFSLEQNYPNPSGNSTRINYKISSQSFVTLKIFDLLGREVGAPVCESQPAGTYQIGLNTSKLANGIYFYELRAADFRTVRKMIVLR